MRKVLLAFFAGLLTSWSSEREQRFAFALPEIEGRISLGVFDTSGKLVRTLFVGAAESEFTIGLNGLITSWDGKDDAGKPLPRGNYRVRGYLVGNEVKTEGVAYHFNDWIEDEKSPRITHIEDFRRSSGGFVVLGKVSDSNRPVVFRFDQLRGFLWSSPLNALAPVASFAAKEPFLPVQESGLPPASFSDSENLSAAVDGMLAATDQFAAAFFSGTLHVLRINDGTIIKTRPESGALPVCMDATGEMLFVGLGESVAKMTLPDLDPIGEEKAPITFDRLAVDAEKKLIASSQRAEVWEFTTAWTKLPLDAAGSSISLGLAGTFWMTIRDPEAGTSFTGQFDKSGELLRAYRNEFSPLRVCASATVEEIAVLEKSGPTQRLRVLSLVEKGLDSSRDWTIAFEKTITDCRRFGIVNGRLQPDAGSAPQNDQVEIALATGGLTESSSDLAVRVTADQLGLWLETVSGLRLSFLASQHDVRRIVLLSGPGKGSLTVYAGDGAAVAEYTVQGLENIVQLDAGEVELP